MKKEKLKSKPRLFRQEKIYSCAVACLRMVLDFYGCERDEVSLCELCATDYSGTSPDALVAAAQQLGFNAEKRYADIFDLMDYQKLGLFPILFINLLSIDGRDMTHAVVLESITRNSLKVLDPWQNARSIPIDKFRVA
ncbi:MAG: cysteine peptidase family C39 domain-containing protein [candidate division KSB1 bacterium]